MPPASREAALLCSFLPILAAAATVAAAATRGATRWTVLVTLPAGFLALFRVSASSVLHDGNLLGGVLFTAYYLGLVIYYPVWLVAGLVALHLTRRNRATREPPSSGLAELKP